jgi:hypothetical protein
MPGLFCGEVMINRMVPTVLLLLLLPLLLLVNAASQSLEERWDQEDGS